MKIKTLFLLLTGWLISTGASGQSQKWTYVGTYDGAKMYFETTELQRSGDKVTTMVKFVNSSLKPVAEGSSIRYKTVVAEYVFNCDTHQYKRNLVVYYDASDEPVYKGSKTGWRSATGDAMRDVMYQLCK